VKLGIKQALTAVAAFGFVATGAASASAGDHVVASAFNLASRLSIGVGFDCKNHPGPSITLGDGQIALGDIEGRLTFANNVKLKHEADADIIAVSPFLTFGTAVKIPKQPSQPADAYGSGFSGTGVGGNPWIYAILNDAKDQPLKKLDGSELGPILLGRCVQGAAVIDVDFLEAILATATITHDVVDSCTNNPGPFIYISGGDVKLTGVSVTIILTNNAKFTHAASGDATVGPIPLISFDYDLKLPKQPPLGGSGGNPFVWFQFLNHGEPVFEFPGFYLGRCVQDL